MRAPSGRRGRRARPGGFALVTALLALVVVGALAAAALFAALQEARLGRNGRAARIAFDAAEAGLAAALADGRAGAWSALVVGDSLAYAGPWGAMGGRYEVRVLRLNGRLFLLGSTGVAAGEGSEQRLGVLARLGPSPVRTLAALVAGGVVEVDGASSLDGRNGDPPGWTGCAGAAHDSVAGLALPDASALAAGAGCELGQCLAGTPPLLAQAALRDSIPWGRREELVRRATLVLPAGSVVTPVPVGGAASCDRTRPDNWGEPERPAGVAGCAGYFPIVLAQGDLTLAGGRGEGTLIVEGDLTVTGDARFAGAVLVGGSLRASGAGGRIFGGAVVEGRGGGVAAHLEAFSVGFSACALGLAAASVGPVSALPERSWATLYR